MIPSSTHRLEAPVYLIKLRVWMETKKRYLRQMRRFTIVRPDKRKSVKGFIWINPNDLPIKNGDQLVTCYKTGFKYKIHPALRTRFR